MPSIIDSTTLRGPQDSGKPIVHTMNVSTGTSATASSDRQKQLEVASEQASPVKEVAKVAEEKLSPRFMALARAQKEMRRQQEAIKAQEASLKQRSESYEKDYIPKTRLVEDALGVLEENGITYDQLVQMAMSRTNPMTQEVKPLLAKIESIEKTIAEQRTSAEENQKKSYEQAMNQIRSEAKALIDSDPAFITIKESEQVEAVSALIEERFKEEGILLSVEDAAKEVEDYLLEDSLKVTNFTKVKAKLAPPTEATPPPKKLEDALAQRPATPQPIKTITNAQTTALSRPLSAAQKRERAILAFQGRLT